MDQTSNIALNRPARQSSTSAWSTNRNPELDARIANNGDIVSQKYFHTDNETNPWWQVELDGVFVIEKISIYNRAEFKDRLNRFTVLRSCNGSDWFPIFQKRGENSFGELSISIDRPGLAKYIRVRLDGYDCLHFRECQIFGRRPDPDEQDRLQAEDECAIKERSRIPDGRKGHLSQIGGFHVFVDDVNYGGKVRRALDNGAYEGKERELVSKFVKSTDRVIEVGTAVGVVSMTAASIVGPQNVLTFDANPHIVADAKENFARNGFEDINGNVAVLVCRKNFGDGKMFDFHISKEFWASRLYVGSNNADIVETVRINTRCLEDEIEKHRANVLICDIEGGEIDLLSEADLSAIRLIIIETHYWAVGELPTDKMISRLIAQGFYLHLGVSGGNISVLRRL
jgi:FkbM family methyltransferase